MLHKKSFFMQLLLFITCTAVTNCALEPAVVSDNYVDNLDAKGDNDANTIAMQKRPSFFVGSRYGRSSGVPASSSSVFASSKSRRLNVVPRNDRFFLGSRYGKRAGAYLSSLPLMGYEQDTPAETFAATPTNERPPIISTSNKSEMNTPFMLSCIYTGVKNLYHCNSIDEINNTINQLTVDENNGDRE